MTDEYRVAARGLLLTPTGRTLLLRTQVSWIGAVWMVPGGGVEPGESLQDAAARELTEETGLQGAPIGPELWQRQVTIHFADRTMRMREHYFLVEVPEFEPSFEGFEDYEHAEHLGHRWWSPGEMRQAPDLFAPAELGAVLEDLLQSGPTAVQELEPRVHRA